MEYGNSSTNPTGYLSGVGYQDLMGGSSSSLDKYYIHEFYIKPDNSVVFTPDTTGTAFTFTSSQTVRLYMHLKYTHTTNLDDSDRFQLREAREGGNHDVPNGTYNDGTGWFAPDIHDNTLGITNAVVGNSYQYTFMPNSSLANTDNDAQVSWTLDIGTRYNLQLWVGDHDPDFEVYLEARANDNGASWNTEYNSSSSLTYTELLDRQSQSSIRTDHFFTIRRDGFIIWEQDPQSHL